MNEFDKWAIHYVFTCAMAAYHRDKNQFLWIMRTVFKNWSETHIRRLIRKLKKEGANI